MSVVHLEHKDNDDDGYTHTLSRRRSMLIMMTRHLKKDLAPSLKGGGERSPAFFALAAAAPFTSIEPEFAQDIPAFSLLPWLSSVSNKTQISSPS